MFKKILLIFAVLAVIATVLFFALSGNASKTEDIKTIKVEKGTIVDKALAVGKIEPRQETSVKSKISGIVKKIYVEVGDYVKIGDPLLDVAPNPTPIEFATAKRNVEIYEVAFENTRLEYERFKTLLDKELISDQEFESKRASYDEARLRLQLAQEQLDLIQSGKTEIADLKVDNIIKSPVNGMILERLVEEGDPVVPLTSYQAGTELMTLAYMEDLIFKGTVDEIDVGKLKVGMTAHIKVGALPKDTVEGEVLRISPKARQDQGSTVFEVEIRLVDLGTNLLRAGYSANADIIVNKKEEILVIPERLIEFVNDTAYVETHDSLGDTNRLPIEIGLSDGINIEVVAGLNEGDMLVERPPREIE
ncbi:MAG: efflux RND transporter periplasmic adaptor subunit [Candidatus Zixiibacteriota bacterium]|nr:MAG: efflux RND transporter periplasmic adaptor subunit [candidate division Zixibacteria bacterium]HDL03693.1 efflux RND transporter periplasmic adaptor subunit [candidate division Zixibacteria bacterium]